MTGGDVTRARARQLALALPADGRKPRLAVLRDTHARLWPDRHSAATSRRDLADVLAAGADAGLWQLPAANGRSWDRTAVPALPTFVTLPGGAEPAPARPSPSRQLLAEVLLPELRWAYDLTGRITASQLDDLRNVDRWLRAGGGTSRPVVPREERSLEVFGDEKHIGNRLGQLTSVWRPGRLDETLLRCHAAPAPLPHAALRRAGTLLVAENKATFWSLTAALRVDPGPVAAVAWGMGGQFSSLLPSVADLPVEVHTVRYFGDLDGKGLRIPLDSAAAARRHGVPQPEPARSLYELLVKHGIAAPVKDDAAVTEDHLRWLPASVQAWASQIVRGGHRVAQEAVGYDVLTADLWWRDAL
jgi:hypothetical protein